MYRSYAAILLVACLATGAFAAAAKPTCGGSSSSKDIQLISPAYPPRECNYHIESYGTYVCQLRIDFAMTLAQPSVPRADNDLTHVQCVDDYFEVNGLRLCGVETNQHIYVPFNRTAGVKKLSMSIVLAARAGATGLPTPSWDISVTQLECPAGAAIRQARKSIQDGFFVAPPGCLQYYPEYEGTFTSFNYNDGKGLYPGNLNYAICFRRTTYTKTLELTANYFKLGAATSESQLLELDNYCYSQARSTGAEKDYLMVPQATIEQSQIHATYFCGTSVRGSTIRSTNPGPLFVLFNSVAAFEENGSGFSISYRQLSN